MGGERGGVGEDPGFIGGWWSGKGDPEGSGHQAVREGEAQVGEYGATPTSEDEWRDFSCGVLSVGARMANFICMGVGNRWRKRRQ